MLDRLMRFVAKPEFAEHAQLARDLFWGDPPDWATDEEFDRVIGSDNGRTAFVPWLMFDFEPEPGTTLLDAFLKRHSATLLPGERAFLGEARASSARCHEIVAVRLDEGFDLRDIESGVTVSVHERSATRQLVRWDIIAARVLRGGRGEAVIENVQAWFGPEAKGELQRLIKVMRRDLAKSPFAGDDLAFYRRFAPVISRLWVERVALPPIPRLTTSDGEPLSLVKAMFDVTDPAALSRILAARKDFDMDGDRYVWVDRKHRVVLGTFAMKANRLTFEGMSEHRAERAHALLKKVAPGLTTHRLTRAEDPEAMLREWRAREAGGTRPRRKGAGPGGRDELPPEVAAELMQEFLDRHYREWPDIPLPALDGRTPRKAARLKTQRPRVVELLKMFESQAARDRLEGRPVYDTSWLWKELGLERTEEP